MARVTSIGSRTKVRIPLTSGRLKFYGFVLLVALVGLSFLYASFTVYIGPDELAVRQVYISLPLGPEKGIQSDIYGPGLYFVLPGYERLHAFPRGLQLLELNDNTLEASSNARYAPSIRIQTSEGYQVTVDVTVAYRITDPYKVITSVGPGRLYETQLVRPRADKYLRQALGELNAEEFYQGDLRISRAQFARRLLSEDLEKSGIQVWNVMVRHYQYDSRYQEAIEQRKIQDQTVFKNRAEARAAEQEAEKNRVLAEGAANVEVERERGLAEVRKIQADADLYHRKRMAEGGKLVALAEAEATQLKNEALQVAGASNVVGLEMAEVLSGLEVIIVPTDGPNGTNPLNLNSLMRGW